MKGFQAESIEYLEAHARLLLGSHETSPIVWIGKLAPAIQRQLRVER